ncbi:BTAD domain-containing putative transcriptional regulator [Pseudonocardia sp. ICBG162]|uniref:BTAD domain-containing putative transcriptional regulator n=1 Tax=Pseudonocardia sp. ICBG162 TaxID=2846761 RepID=UPI001CF684A9|nr:BTAD domain-containing putative transcriptional regulator [Pseudonocardia sp. ICBG162]
MVGHLRLRVLGPVEIGDGDTAVVVRRPLERGLLVRLALARGVVVPDGMLAADLWDDDEGTVERLRVVVSRLRRTLGPAGAAVVRAGGGYRVDADVPDLRAMTAAAERADAAARAGDHATARAAAGEALGCWRGPALSDLRSLPFARAEADRLDGRRVELTVARLAAEQASGDGAPVPAELVELAARHPLHEPLRGMLAVGLYRAGRQADALAELAGLRRTLADELGVDPTAATTRLELRLLRQDPDLLPAPAPPPAPAGRAGAAVAPAPDTGLVGRDAELAVLAGALDRALAGEPAVVLVEGGPGIGRTRLLEAAGVLAAARGIPAATGRAVAGGGAPVFGPWRRALERWAREVGPAVAGPVLAGAPEPVARVLPELGGTPPPPGPAPSGPDERLGLFEHVAALVADAADAGPGLVLLLDDLHLADPASLMLLGHVARTDRRCPLLVVVSLTDGALDDDRAAARAALLRAPATVRIAPAGLPADAVAVLLRRESGRAPDEATVAAVVRRTGGNPLFVRELARVPDSAAQELPAAVRDVVAGRLAVHSAPVREVLVAAAVLGGGVDADLVAAVTGTAVVDVLDRLDDAVAAGLLAPDHHFAHEIVRDAVVLQAARGTRARIHLRAAEHLDATGGDGAALAHHRLAALPLGDRAAAVRAATAAADLALHRFAFEEAAALLERALAAGPGGPPERAALLLDRARAQYLGHDVAGAVRSCEDAAALAAHLDDPELLGRAATLLPEVGDAGWLATSRRWCRTALAGLPDADSPLRARLTAQLAAASAWDDDRAGPDRVVATGTAALAMGERVGDPAACAIALRALQLARSGPAGTRPRLDLGDRMTALADGLGDSAELWGRLWRFDALVQLGRTADAEAELDLLEPVVARMRRPLPHWHLVRNRACLLSARGRFTEARAAADEAIRLAERGHHPAAEYPAHALRTSIAMLTGDPLDPRLPAIERQQPPPRLLTMLTALWQARHGDAEEAAALYEQLPRPETVALRPFMEVLFHATSGGLAAALGDDRAADHAYAALSPWAELHVAAGAGVAWTEGSVHGVLGVIAGARGRTGDAVDHLRAAVAADAAAGLLPHACLARARLAAALRRRGDAGDRAEADALAAEAAGTAARLGLALP